MDSWETIDHTSSWGTTGSLCNLCVRESSIRNMTPVSSYVPVDGSTLIHVNTSLNNPSDYKRRMREKGRKKGGGKLRKEVLKKMWWVWEELEERFMGGNDLNLLCNIWNYQRIILKARNKHSELSFYYWNASFVSSNMHITKFKNKMEKFNEN